MASWPITPGVNGMAGQCYLVVTAPVSAQEMMTLSVDTPGPYRKTATSGRLPATRTGRSMRVAHLRWRAGCSSPAA